MNIRNIEEIILSELTALTLDYRYVGESNLFSDSGNTEDTDQDFTTTGADEDKEWMARKFTPTVGGRVHAVYPIIGATGTPAGSFYIDVYSDDGGATSMPNAKVYGSSQSVLATSFSTDAAGAVARFTFSQNCPLIETGTPIWAVMKSTGFTYSDGVTEVRWRTDANGAVGLNECAKYDANAGTPWTSLGADVGADLAVVTSPSIPIGSAGGLIFYINFVKGSSAGMNLQVEFSHDGIYWFRESHPSLTDVYTDDLIPHEIVDDGPIKVFLDRLGDRHARASVKAITDATGASAAIRVIVSD